MREQKARFGEQFRFESHRSSAIDHEHDTNGILILLPTSGTDNGTDQLSTILKLTKKENK